jgi:hypothetical protein
MFVRFNGRNGLFSVQVIRSIDDDGVHLTRKRVIE